MKVLFTTLAHNTHFYPMVPLAWALRTAGHEVRVASQPDLAETITESGLTAVPVGPAEAEWTLDDPVAMELLEEIYEEGALYVYEFDFDDREGKRWTPERLLTLENIMVPSLLAAVNNDPMIDDLVDFARSWQPDLVIWEAFTMAGAVAARATGAAHARLLWAPDITVRARQEFLGQAMTLPPEHREDPTAEWLEWTLNRFGQNFDDEILTGQWTIDPSPPSTRLDLGGRTIGVRYVPHNGPSVVPEFLRTPPSRRRVCLSFGLSEAVEGLGEALADTLQAFDGVDAEVIATVDPAELDPLPELPGNVRLAGFVPLNDLLPSCSAIVHHGGTGTRATAELHGVPQITLAYGAEVAVRAAQIEELGAGLTMPMEELTSSALREKIIKVLDDPSFAENAMQLRTEILAEPTPNDLVPLLEKMTAEYRTAPAHSEHHSVQPRS
ncbi:activator-dependent family glycosyltransferase [Amycolatopsis sp. cmx-11-12]|uniref:activator-dependent family glycosyltransferase n=1 Tax=Amycolatopsis sp. cmx-11-12 TaxID=2785795 RepID=UPI003918373F